MSGNFIRFLLLSLLLSGCVSVEVSLPLTRMEIETKPEQLRRAVQELKTLGTACEAYLVDNGYYPKHVGGRIRVGSRSFSPVKSVMNELGLFSRSLPAEDPWGSDYLYWSDEEQYVILSRGTDGQLGDPEELSELFDQALGKSQYLTVERSRCWEDELVLINGRLVRWPSNHSAECSK